MQEREGKTTIQDWKSITQELFEESEKTQNPNVYYRYVVFENKIQIFERTAVFLECTYTIFCIIFFYWLKILNIFYLYEIEELFKVNL
jgi:hypothetical protein